MADPDLLRYPFGAPECGAATPQPPDLPDTAEEIHDGLDIGAIEQDVFLLKATLLNLD